MSRSDRTDPLPIRTWFSSSRVDVHDHRGAECDLPITLADFLRGTSRCTWEIERLARTQCACLHQHHTHWRDEDPGHPRRVSRRMLDEVRRLVNAGHTAETPHLPGGARR